MKSFEIISHTADIGLKISGRSLEELFRNGALGFFNLITDPERVRERGPEGGAVREVLEIRAADSEDLFLGWLKELLYVFSVRRLVLTDFDFEDCGKRHVKAVGRGTVFDPARDVQKYEIKAVTYHQFELRKQKNGWQARVIFDI